jgi:hypothetical protein
MESSGAMRAARGSRRAGFLSRSEARRWFWDVERKRMRGELVSPTPLTLAELVEGYIEQHVAEANTIRALRDRLKLARHGIPVKPRAKESEHGLGITALPSGSTAIHRRLAVVG